MTAEPGQGGRCNRGAILATRGSDGSTAVVPGAGTPPSGRAWAARTWKQLAAGLPPADGRRAPCGGNGRLHGPTTSDHVQRRALGWNPDPGAEPSVGIQIPVPQ